MSSSHTPSSARKRHGAGQAQSRGKKQRSVPEASLTGAGGGLAVTILLLILLSALLSGMEHPGAFVLPMSLLAFYAGAVTAGAFAAARSGGGVFAGLLSGVIYAAAVFLCSFLPLPSSGLSGDAGGILLLLSIPTAVLGAVIGQPKGKARRSKR